MILFQYEISANAKAQQTTDGLGGNMTNDMSKAIIHAWRGVNEGLSPGELL
jgi:hypothetical protein